MAALVVGLSKVVVAGTLAKVDAAILEDADLRQKAERDLGYIMEEFQMMQAFLNVANETSVKNHLVMTWVRNVRELAYDLEDCVEFVVHLDSKRIIWRRMIPKSVMVYLTCILPLPLDRAVAELGDLKARAEELSKRYLRYCSINDSTGCNLIMLQQPVSGAAIGASGLNRLLEARDVATRRKGFVDLANFLKGDVGLHLQAVSLWGTAGDLGKTSIIRKVYHDPEIYRNFSCRAWVKLVHPFNPHEFIRHFMTQVYTNSSGEQGSQVGVHVLKKMEVTSEDLLMNFVREVSTKRYFVVLEDLSNMVDWDAIRTFLPDTGNGSRIVVSTQQFEIACLCVGRSYQVIELEKLSVDHSVYAFFDENLHITRTDDYISLNVNRQRHAGLTSLISEDDGDKRKAAASKWMMMYPLIGRDMEINKLFRYTNKAGVYSVQVMALWGIAGVGKSAVAERLFCNMILQENQFHKYRWVAVSHPFDLRNFCSSLLQESAGSSTSSITGCRQLLEDRCLVVIDEIRSKEEWDLIKTELLSESSQGVIIVITTEVGIARHCCADNDELVFNVTCLDAMAAVQLFDKEVQMNDNPASLIELHGSAELEELILKCGGFPKVIVTIACLLATKTLTWMDTVKSLTGKFIHNLETNPEFYSLRCLFGRMRSILCNSLDSLKPCIFYLSIFPRNHIIRRRRLIRRWIAEGYCMDKDENSAEEEGESNFSELLELTIVQQLPQLATSTFNNDTRMALCHINSLIHEYIVSRRMEENLVFEIGCNCALTTQNTGRHLVILESWERKRVEFESIDLSRLRSLTVFGKWESFFLSESMKVLRVLDLENASDVAEVDLEKMVKQLSCLKFLSLRGHMKIRHLPKSLGDLRQLQTLDVRGTSIVTLPPSITKLQKLQYIRAGSTPGTIFEVAPTAPASYSCLPEFSRRHHLVSVGVVVPRRTGQLMALHTLGVVNVADSRADAFVEELRKLTQLRKLGVSGINHDNIRELFSAIEGHGLLESLSVQIDKGRGDCLEVIWRYHRGLENLRSLKLYGLNDMLPDLGTRRNKLTKLHLEMATFPDESGTVFFDSLPQLCILRIKLLQDGKLYFHSSYEKLKVLEIACRNSSSSLRVRFRPRAMQKLELLKVDCCGGSPSYKFSFLEDLQELKQVLLLNSSNAEPLEQELERQLADHPNNPAVKLEELPRTSTTSSTSSI